MNSGIYIGHVAHNRPGKHQLRYSIFMLAIDLDDLPRLSLKRVKHNRPALFSFHDRDHVARIDAPLRPQIAAKLEASGIDWGDGRIVLLTIPRLFNYVFNPLNVYFCYRKDGALTAVVHEVSNTFGEWHFYVLPAHENNGVVTQSCNKQFFVSPFLEMDLRYEFRIRPPGDDVSVAMIVWRGDEVALTASFAGRRRELTDANLLRAWLSNPLMTIKVIAGIHWEALKMWIKGVGFIGRNPKPAQKEAAA